jgi:hypothetical protein
VAGFDLSIKQIKAGFFDAQKILSAADKARAKVESQFGAFTRRRMQTSLRYRKKASAPGKPPSVHRGKTGKSPLRELIFFSRDPGTGSVVIGPLGFKAKGARTLEKGGFARVKATDGKGGARYKTIFIRPRPFVKPAGDAEAAKLPALLRKLVR